MPILIVSDHDSDCPEATGLIENDDEILIEFYGDHGNFDRREEASLASETEVKTSVAEQSEDAGLQVVLLDCFEGKLCEDIVLLAHREHY